MKYQILDYKYPAYPHAIFLNQKEVDSLFTNRNEISGRNPYPYKANSFEAYLNMINLDVYGWLTRKIKTYRKYPKWPTIPFINPIQRGFSIPVRPGNMAYLVFGNIGESKMEEYYGIILFRKASDAVLFKLTWG